MKRSCFLTRKPIAPGDMVVAVVLRQMPWLPTNAGYLDEPTDLWAPVSLPIYGRMGHLGLDEVEDSWVKDALFTWIDDFATEDPNNTWAVGPLTPDTWSGPHAWIEMEKRIRQGTLTCNVSGHAPEASGFTSALGIVYMHADDYEDAAGTPVDLSIERQLLDAARVARESFNIEEGGLAAMARAAADLQQEMSRLRFEIEDNNVPFFGEGVMSFHRAYLVNKEGVSDDAITDLLQFDQFQNHLKTHGIPWLPNVAVPETA